VKVRPNFNLRLRTEQQFEQIKELAQKCGISMNEWILRKIEAEGPRRK
jgi:predicted HicB family RNase H-like nuclease